MIIVVNSNTTLDPGFQNYVVDASSSNITLTLPLITGEGTSYTITRTDLNNLNTVTIVPSGADTIDLQLSHNLFISNAVNFIALGTNWIAVIKQNGLTGLTGPTGPRGLTGATGIPGVTGLTGVPGITGALGVTGFRGETGFQGLTGFTGLRGITGFTGLQGFTGLTGFTGLRGGTGFLGQTGLTGIQGDPGATGLTGVRGFTGLTGLTGSFGLTGLTGSGSNLLYTNKIMVWEANGNGTSVNLLVFNNVTTGTVVTYNVATTNLKTSIRRIGYQTTNVAGNIAGTTHNAGLCFRGTAGYGGFYYAATIAGTTQTASIFTVGLVAAVNNFTTNFIAFRGTAGANWTIQRNDGAGGANSTTLGANFPVNSTDIWRATFFSPPGGGNLTVTFSRLNTAFTFTTTFAVNNVTLPTATTILIPQIAVTRGSAGQPVIDVISQYMQIPW